jgi:hypothetical protein
MESRISQEQEAGVQAELTKYKVKAKPIGNYSWFGFLICSVYPEIILERLIPK